MNIVEFKEKEHYGIVSDWWERWKNWKCGPIPANFLSNIGVMVSNRGVFICAGWLYTSNSDIAHCEWIISNPDSSKEDRTGCIEYMMGHMSTKAGETELDCLTAIRTGI